MLRKYRFSDGTVEFDDSKNVRALLAYAFDAFGYYEPIGMQYVTLFQCHHSRSDEGWFTTDVDRSCAEEIENRDELCYAYHMPGVFYFAEGGWGHHMVRLGNHPELPDPVSLSLKFEDFENEVVISGRYCLRDVVRFLQRSGYVDSDLAAVRVLEIPTRDSVFPRRYAIPLTDPIMGVKLVGLEGALADYRRGMGLAEDDSCRMIFKLSDAR